MVKKRNEQASRIPEEAEKPHSDRGVYQSGVVDKALVERVRQMSETDPWREGEHPPWSLVDRYLTSGENRELIEEHARRSRPFADVLEAMRNDAEERDDGAENEGGGSHGLPDPFEPLRPHKKRPRHLRPVR